MVLYNVEPIVSKSGGAVAKCGSRWSPLFQSQSILGAAAQDSVAEINSGGHRDHTATKRN